MQGVIQRLGGDYVGVGIDSIGRSAGVAILWKEGVDVEIVSSTAHHIDVVVRGLFCLDEWRLTGVYGWSRNEDKWKTWQLMRDIKPLSNLPWVMIGDFNQILFEHEKKGGIPREQNLMDDFREALNDCELLDIGFSGNPHTWWNRRGGSDAVYERLDRALASTSFLVACPAITLSHLEFDKSDHAPLKLAMFTPIKSKKGNKFRFEDMWATSEGCEEVVRNAWENAVVLNQGQVALRKLSICSKNLVECSRIQFGDLRRQVEEARKRMNFLDSCPNDLEAVSERKAMCSKLDGLLMAEETYWRQRSCVCYLVEGDKNTRFFHLRASNRKRRNRITRLKDTEGNWVVDEGK